MQYSSGARFRGEVAGLPTFCGSYPIFWMLYLYFLRRLFLQGLRRLTNGFDHRRESGTAHHASPAWLPRGSRTADVSIRSAAASAAAHRIPTRCPVKVSVCFADNFLSPGEVTRSSAKSEETWVKNCDPIVPPPAGSTATAFRSSAQSNEGPERLRAEATCVRRS
jgi:hypothetical protein